MVIPVPISSCKTKLLVSVRDEEEALLAQQAEVDWVDLKNPDQGPLGAPSLEMARAVSETMAPEQASSVAVGELLDLEHNYLNAVVGLFPVFKVGLSGCGIGDASTRWRDMMDQAKQIGTSARSQLVPVAYADWEECGGIHPTQVLEYAANRNLSIVLMDTYHKDGRTLLDSASFQSLEDLVQRGLSVRVRFVLAGSLDWTLAHRLWHLPIEAVGIRGAVCDGRRDGPISAERLHAWVQKFLRSKCSETR